MDDKALLELIKSKLKDEQLPDQQRLSPDTVYVIGFIRGIEYAIKHPA